MSLLPGTTLGRYQILEPLGQGGMATVYKAFQPSLQREVALKVLRPGYAQDEEFRGRFEREAIAIAKLRHPHIVQVFDFEVAPSGEFVLAMEFLDGGTLKERTTQLAAAGRGLDPAESIRILWEVADALSYAHEQGIVHRDVKPSNVMLAKPRDRAVVTDFGIARMLGATSHTQTGVGIGTPEYMAPEQGQGGHVDHRADIYSLGAMAYELLVGRVPYTADTPLAIVIAHIKDPLPLPSAVNPTVGPSVEKALLTALAKDPAQRFDSAVAFAEALRAGFAEDTGGGTLPTIVVRGAPPGASTRTAIAAAPEAAGQATGPVPSILARRPVVTGIAAGIVLALVAGGVVAGNAFRSSPPAAAQTSPSATVTTAAATTTAAVSASTSGAAATPKFAVPPKGKLLYEAKLDGTESDIRQQLGTPPGGPTPPPGSTSLRVVPGAIELSVLQQGYAVGVVLNSPSFDDYVLEYDLQPGSRGRAAAYIRHTAFGFPAYLASIDEAQGSIDAEIETARGAPPASLTSSATIAGLQGGSTFTIAVVAQHSDYAVYVDQTRVLTFRDDRVVGPAYPAVLIKGQPGTVPGTVRIVGVRVYALP